ncbi:hypothetical protein ABZ953_37965 [Streptomyces sp. NPDC046465]|uniref:hypothetical protein n=1 Tax=Streptomyces sp. NPDC046465 TaxID=3155810 RepID=UPI0033C3AF7B
MTHTPAARPGPTPHSELPRLPRPRPHSHEPRLLARMLPGTDEPPAPGVVRTAFALWLTAVAAGVFETVLAVGREVSGGRPGSTADGLTDGLAWGVPLRMAVFAAVVLVAVRMRRGARWARLTLTGGPVALGALSLAAWTAHRPGIGDAFRDVGVLDVLTGAGRALHLAALLTATVLMFRPAANAWFRAARRR